MDLNKKHCVPCEGGVDPFDKEKINRYLNYLGEKWEVIDNKKIKYTFEFESFRDGINFVDKIADIAEEEGHHPDICINYKKVTIELMTHAIDGLSENDFILATKIELLIT